MLLNTLETGLLQNTLEISGMLQNTLEIRILSNIAPQVMGQTTHLHCTVRDLGDRTVGEIIVMMLTMTMMQ